MTASRDYNTDTGETTISMQLIIGRTVLNLIVITLLLSSAATIPTESLSDNEEKNTIEFEIANQKDADLPVMNLGDAKAGEQNDGQQEPITGFDQQAFEYKNNTDYAMAPEKCTCPCKAKPTTEYINGKWLQLANTKVPEEVLESTALNTPIEDSGAELRNFETGTGWVRTDFYGVTVCLATDKDPKEYLKELMNNPDAFLPPIDVPFLPGIDVAGQWVNWPVAGVDGRQQGDVVDLDILGENGAIVYLDVDISDGEFCVMTLVNKKSGTHPVAGTRCWGYEEMGSKEVMFYTTGIETSNIRGTGDLGQISQDKTWEGLMEGIADRVVKDGGASCKIFADDEWHSQSDLIKLLRKAGKPIKQQHLDDTVEIDAIAGMTSWGFWWREF